MKIRSFAALAGAVTMLAGCAGMQRALPETPATPQALEQLQQVRDQYAAGHYGEVVRQVAKSDELAGSTRAVRVEAYKLQAFSYCVTRYTQLCVDSFARILALDPSFELAPNEAGHPAWGPAPARPGAGRTLRPAPRESRPRKARAQNRKAADSHRRPFLFPASRAGLRARSCPKAPLIRRRPRRPDRRQGRPHRNPP